MSCTVVIKDKNLKPENIKMGITILKVTGTFEGGGGGGEAVLEEKTVNSSTLSQEVLPSEGFDGLSKVTVEPYTLDSKTVNSSTSQQTVTSSADGLSSVTVNPYTLDSKAVDPSTSEQVVTSSADGLSSVTVNAVTSSIDSNIQADNIKKDVTILGVTGTYESAPTQPNLQDVSVTYVSNGNYTLSASDGYDGLGTVDVSVNVPSSGGSDWLVDALAGNITDLSGYTLPAPTHKYQYAYLFANTAITSTPDLSSFTSISYENECYGMFQDCTSLTSANLSNLTTITGTFVAGSMFSGCSNLTTVDLSNLTSWSGTSPVSSMFKGCYNLTTLRCHPNLYESNGNNTIAFNLGNIVNLTFTAMSEPYNNIYLSSESHLSAESVYNVLTHLNTSRGSTCEFYRHGLTVTDFEDGRIQTAYNAAVADGWTINNLTITPFS